MTFKDPIMLQEEKLLQTQIRLLQILEPFNDEARIRIMRAVAAYYQPVDKRILDEIMVKRAKAFEAQIKEKENADVETGKEAPKTPPPPARPASSKAKGTQPKGNPSRPSEGGDKKVVAK